MAFPNDRSNNPNAPVTWGRDFNFYQLISVNNTIFNSNADAIITFPTQGLSIISYGATSANTIEYSFNGNAIHGDMVPQTPSAALVWDYRIVSKIWLRLKTGSTGPVNIRIEAWARQ